MDADIVAVVKLNGYESKVGIKITEADAEVIATKTRQLGLALNRGILKLAFELGIEVVNSNLKQVKEDLAKELISTLENSIKLLEEMGEN